MDTPLLRREDIGASIAAEADAALMDGHTDRLLTLLREIAAEADAALMDGHETCSRSPLPQQRAAEADAALMDGHFILLLLPAWPASAAEADAALMDGHKRSRSWSTPRRRRGGRRGPDGWTLADGPGGEAAQRAAEADAALMDGHAGGSDGPPQRTMPRRPTRP